MAFSGILPPETSGPYLVAKRAGRDAYRNTGELILPELVISSVLVSLFDGEGRPRSHYDGPHNLNLRRSIFIVADKDSKKGSVMTLWSSKIVGMSHIADMDEKLPRGITYTRVSRGTTYESLRGGGTAGNLNLPVFPRLTYVLVPEAMSWFGHDPRQRADLVDQLNTAMEDDTVDVCLDKMKAANAKTRQSFKGLCDDIGVKFSTIDCSMSYTCPTTFIFASRRPDDKTWDHMLNSGFLSRTAVVEWEPDPETYRAYKLDQVGEPDDVDIDYLRRFHEKVQSIHWKRVQYPDISMVNKAMAATQELYDALAEQTGIQQKEFEISRELQYFAQLMTFNAVWRMVRNNPDATEFEQIDYKDDDIDFAIRHFTEYIYPVVERRAMSSVSTESKKRTPFEEALPILNSFIKMQRVDAVERAEPNEHIAHKYQHFGGGEFYSYYVDRKPMSNPTFQTRLLALVEAGIIRPYDQRGRERIYEVLNSHIHSLGYKSISDESEEEEKRFAKEIAVMEGTGS